MLLQWRERATARGPAVVRHQFGRDGEVREARKRPIRRIELQRETARPFTDR